MSWSVAKSFTKAPNLTDETIVIRGDDFECASPDGKGHRVTYRDGVISLIHESGLLLATIDKDGTHMLVPMRPITQTH